MKFQLVSDLHLEKYDKLPDIKNMIVPQAKYLILAGDICYAKHRNFLPFFEFISPLFEKIFYIFGNHEYHNVRGNFHSINEIEIYIKNLLDGFSNITVLQKDFYIFEEENVVIVGATLWTYLSQKNMIAPIKYLPETDFISYRNKIMFHPKITNKIHFEHKKRIDYMLTCFEEKKTIVVSHHLPSKRCIEKKYKYDIFSKLYYSNCDELVKRATVWCAGHTHQPMIRKIDGVPIYINPYGYLWEHNSYKKDFVFEI